MAVALVTGSAGLVGSASVRFLARKKFDRILGIDNDMRKYFFGREASTRWNLKKIREEVPGYVHHALDIRNRAGVEKIFAEHGSDIRLIIHTAAQPSHDWASREPFSDFTINANGTLVLLEMMRLHAPKAVFIFTSTNKVYGDNPNFLPLRELETRWEIEAGHPYADGIDESMSIDRTMHSLFGASKVAADVLVQEYGRYFGLRTACFRGGCLTGPDHSGAQLHGFLAYLMKCAITGQPYTVFGYKGKQVRDNIHSARPGQHVLAFLQEAPERRRLQRRRRPVLQLLHARGDRPVRGDHREKDELDLLGDAAARRPHLVCQRAEEVPRRLPGLGFHF